ncbi:hypothetical protein [Actinomadura sp. HBU206391]|uniref:hypothetical protein n=1 Tax=Actinomadura sp. HBU206391 TaxID=2731692 RepID=UPI0016508FC8|nr:hypothetical protein [Actinomadura sp. HBU206391]MBC6458801.1 hypothetical protein [Actinomadura sp. HBU206391]
MSGVVEPQGAPDPEIDAEIGELIGRLSSDEDMDKETRGRLLGRLARLLSASARRAGVTGIAGGRWLGDVFAYVAPRIPVRDLETLRRHHDGHLGELLADDLVRMATNGTTAVGAAGGALAAVEFVAPPLLLSVPAQLVAETLVVSAIEVKLIAELHEVYGVQVPGGGSARAAVFLTAWAKQRGINPMAGGTMTVALGTAAKQALRKRLLRILGRHLTTLGPFLTGAVAGGALNRAFTRRLAESVRKDLRRHVGPSAPVGPVDRPRLGPAD